MNLSNFTLPGQKLALHHKYFLVVISMIFFCLPHIVCEATHHVGYPSSHVHGPWNVCQIYNLLLERIISFADECTCTISLLAVPQEVDSYHTLCPIEPLDTPTEQVNSLNVTLKKKKTYKLTEVTKISYKEGR